MASNSCSGTFSCSSFGGYRRCPSSTYPSNLVYSTDVCSPSPCQWGSFYSRSYRDICYEPARCQSSIVLSRPCQTSCFQPKSSILCSPHDTCTGSLGCGSSSSRSLGFGSRSSYSVGCGSRGLGSCGFPSLSSGTRFCSPVYFPSGGFYSSYYQPLCTFGFY
ncbi:keratin-associated protein 13-1-like [Sorex araneus]|uniref:keratin-associated protein 13-1-like n=1 Tax=Sorex araneus TaxID=42254 RepID=UPI002433B251|nr:keratin-associated protein 13-1-like [Sorex araneus]